MTSTMKWSEMNDDEYNFDDDFGGLVTVDEDIKTTTQFVTEPEGLVKVVTKSKIYKRAERFSRTAMERKARMCDLKNPKHGKEDLAKQAEECFIDLPKSMRKVGEEDDDEGGMIMDRENNPGIPMVRKDGVKDKFNQLRKLDGAPDAFDRDDDLGFRGDFEDKIERSDKQQPPRGRIGDQRDDCTVRVTNLSEETKEPDLDELFGRIGKISRIYLAKNKDTQSSKGFAFITYEDRTTAEQAIRQLDRHGYDSLLLKVEWSKPSAKPRD